MIDTKGAIPSCKKLFAVELFVFNLVRFNSLRKALDVKNDNTKKRNLNCWEIIFIIAALWSITFMLFSLVKTIPQYLGIHFSLTCFIISFIFSVIITLIKFFQLWSCRLEFYLVFKSLNDIWEETIRKRVDLTVQITKIINNSKPLRHFHIFSVLVLCFCYVLRFHIILVVNYLTLPKNESMAYTEHLYPEIYFPIRLETLGNYLLLLVMQHQFVFFAGVYFVLADLLFISLTTVIAVNFMVLADEYLNILEIYLATNKSQRAIANIIHRHCLLLSLCQQITYLFSPIIFSTMIFNGIDICCTIFALQQELAVGGEKTSLIKNLAHTIILITQILTYCNCAHIATEQSEALREAIYNSSWLDGDKKIMKAVIIIMINTQNGYIFSVYGLFILNRQQLTQIFNTTSSYFMLLRNFA